MPIDQPPSDIVIVDSKWQFAFKGNSFFDSNNSPDEPLAFGDGNVFFPRGWTEEMAREWREKYNVPGREWPKR